MKRSTRRVVNEKLDLGDFFLDAFPVISHDFDLIGFSSRFPKGKAYPSYLPTPGAKRWAGWGPSHPTIQSVPVCLGQVHETRRDPQIRRPRVRSTRISSWRPPGGPDGQHPTPLRRSRTPLWRTETAVLALSRKAETWTWSWRSFNPPPRTTFCSSRAPPPSPAT